MTSRNDLDLEQKVKLMKDKENGMSVRELKDKLNVSIGSVSKDSSTLEKLKLN